MVELGKLCHQRRQAAVLSPSNSFRIRTKLYNQVFLERSILLTIRSNINFERSLKIRPHIYCPRLSTKRMGHQHNRQLSRLPITALHQSLHAIMSSKLITFIPMILLAAGGSALQVLFYDNNNACSPGNSLGFTEWSYLNGVQDPRKYNRLLLLQSSILICSHQPRSARQVRPTETSAHGGQRPTD